MISGALTRRAQELAERRSPFVTATVVRVQRPTSVKPGSVALVHDDGTIEGFVGGVCAQHSVRLYSLKAIERGEPLLLRILPDGPEGAEEPAGLEHEGIDAGHEVATDEDGAVTVQNPCLSGGAIEVFLEPFLPAPRMIVAGDAPIGDAVRRLAPELGLELVEGDPSGGDLALVVAAHGRDELEVLRLGLEAGVPYVGLVASRKRGAAVIEALRSEGVEDALLERIESPAGLDIGARSPAEIALSILARVIEVRRRGGITVPSHAPPAPTTRTAIDPICGMTVVVLDDTPATERDGETFYFCCEGCRRKFEQPAP
jgi:xanthine dehydrogenase accessory factor